MIIKGFRASVLCGDGLPLKVGHTPRSQKSRFDSMLFPVGDAPAAQSPHCHRNGRRHGHRPALAKEASPGPRPIGSLSGA